MLQRALRLGAVLLSMAFLVPAASPADSAAAAALLGGGKKALDAKKFDEATSMFRKALAEDSALIEAVYWLAVAREKGGEEAAALADYRQFLALLEKKGGGASAEEQKLRPLAEKRVDALAAWEKEFLKIEEKYVGELLTFATERAEGEPWVAVRALDLVLKVRPKYAAALSLRERIAGKGGGQGGVDLFPQVKEWRDLLAEQAFRPVEGILSYAGNVITMDLRGAKVGHPRKPIIMGPAFAYEIEFRVLETYDDGWSVGLMFGSTQESLYDVGLRKAAVVLRLGGRGVATRELESRPVAPKDLSTWRRLSIGIRGDTVQVSLDGKQVFEERITDRADLAGDIGISVANCKSEWRVLRTGSL